MLDFPIQVYEHPLDRKAYASSFVSPIVFFVTDHSDPRYVLAAFALCDFERGRITYITSSSPENRRKLDALTDPSLRQSLAPLPRGHFRQVHSVIETSRDESFYAFIYASEPCNFFCHVDYKHRVMRVYTGDDFRAIAGCGPVDSFGSTFAPDPADPSHFFLNVKLASHGSDTPAIAYYRVALDFSRAALLGRRACSEDHPCPHATRRHGDYLLSSEFHEAGYQLLTSGREFTTAEALRKHVLQDYWSRLEARGRASALATQVLAHPFKFFRIIKRAWRAKDGRSVKDLAIDRCFRGRHPSQQFAWACQDVDEYRFHVAPGCIRVLPLSGGPETAHTVSHSTPAHFEIGRRGDIYLSCHNFLQWDLRRYLIEPAAILRLRMNGAVPEERGVFQHPTAFRFASHIVFESAGREFLCTVGQPNRLFLVDAESMKLVAFKDIGIDHISSATNLPFFLSRTNLESVAVRSLSASEDGRFLAIADSQTVFVLDLGSLDIVDSLPVTAWMNTLTGRTPGELLNDAAHCQRLR
jgi:hypothetical protein